MTAKIFIQCKDSEGITGDFLRDNNTGLKITPTFRDFSELIDYCNDYFPDRTDKSIGFYKINTVIK